MIYRLALVAAIAGLLAWGVSERAGISAEAMTDAMRSAAITGEIHSIDGAVHGYFLPLGDRLEIDGVGFREIEVAPPVPGCGDPGYIRLRATRLSEGLGEGLGEADRMLEFSVEAYAVTAEGFYLRARHEEAGTLLIDGEWSEGAVEQMGAGADAIGELMTATLMLGSQSRTGVEYGFWIGD